LLDFNVNPSYTTIFGKDYRIISSGETAGGTSTDVEMKFFHFDAGTSFSPNDGTNEGAALVYTAPWNFNEAGNAVIDSASTIQYNANNNVKCISGIKYKVDSDDQYPYRYIMFCPLKDPIAADPDDVIILTNFVFPYVNGIKMPDAYSSISTNTGRLLKY
jgi:hypothetical protein